MIVTIHYSDQLNTFVLINNHLNLQPFSNIFASSFYHSLLLKCIYSYLYVLEANTVSYHHVPIQKISNLCIVFQEHD